MTTNSKRLERPADSSRRVLGGVAAGLANYFAIDTMIVRILFLIAIFGFGTGGFIYLALWFIMPMEGKTGLFDGKNAS